MERDRLLQQSTEHVGEQSTTPRSAKGSPREAVGPGYFQSPRGHQVHLPFHLALGGTNRNRWSNGMPFDVTRRVGNSQYDNQTMLCTNHTVLHNTGESAPFASVLVRRSGSGEYDLRASST